MRISPIPIAAGLSLALIQKVNIWVMGQGLTFGRKQEPEHVSGEFRQRSQHELLQFV